MKENICIYLYIIFEFIVFDIITLFRPDLELSKSRPGERCSLWALVILALCLITMIFLYLERFKISWNHKFNIHIVNF